MYQSQGKIDINGKLYLPTNVRKQLGLEKNTNVVMLIQEDHLVIKPVQQAIIEAQTMIQEELKTQGIATPTNFTEEFIADRRAEAQKELEKYGS